MRKSTKCWGLNTSVDSLCSRRHRRWLPRKKWLRRQLGRLLSANQSASTSSTGRACFTLQTSDSTRLVFCGCFFASFKQNDAWCASFAVALTAVALTAVGMLMLFQALQASNKSTHQTHQTSQTSQTEHERGPSETTTKRSRCSLQQPAAAECGIQTSTACSATSDASLLAQAPLAKAPPAEAPPAKAPPAEAPVVKKSRRSLQELPEAPTAQAPTAEAPTAEAPTAQTPTAEAPTAQAPTAQAPTAAPTGAVLLQAQWKKFFDGYVLRNPSVLNDFVKDQEKDYKQTSFPTRWHDGVLVRDVDSAVLIPKDLQARVLWALANKRLSAKQNMQLMQSVVYWDDLWLMLVGFDKHKKHM